MSAARPVLLAWSGGKDAAWTLHRLRQRDDVVVAGLLTTFVDAQASPHGLPRDLLQAQARAAQLPLLEVTLPADCPDETYARRMAEALHGAAARWPGLRTMAYGDLALQDVRDWRARQLARIGWDIETPLFGRDTRVLAGEMLAGGLRATLCCVDTTRLAAGFGGRAFDAALLAALPPGVDPCGEHGEFHTCVSAGPMFAAPLRLQAGATELREGRFAMTRMALLP